MTQAQLPWELCHDGDHFLVLTEDLHLNRYITYYGDRHSFEPVEDINILYIIARPRDQERLPDYVERDAMIHALSGLIDRGRVSVTFLEESTYAALKARLVELELQGLKEEIARVKEMIAEEEKRDQKVVVSGKSPVRQQLEGDLLMARARLLALRAREVKESEQIGSYEQQLKTLDGYEKELTELERGVSINDANYKLYLTKFEEAKISQNMDKQKIANVRVIEPAVPIMNPVKPKKRFNVAIGGFLGLFAGVCMAFLIEFIHPVFRTREDVDQFLGLPVLAVLPREKPKEA